MPREPLGGQDRQPNMHHPLVHLQDHVRNCAILRLLTRIFPTLEPDSQATGCNPVSKSVADSVNEKGHEQNSLVQRMSVLESWR